jgi:hypothetical protein
VKVFGEVAELYDDVRPGYPVELRDAIVEHLGRRPEIRERLLDRLAEAVPGGVAVALSTSLVLARPAIERGKLASARSAP